MSFCSNIIFRIKKNLSFIFLTLFLTSCSGSENNLSAASWHAKETIRAGGGFKIGREYTVLGQTYRPSVDPNYSEIGIASWYGPGFHRGRTANNEKYDQYALTAAHRTLPMPSLVKVTNLENNKQIVLRINDRGPFASNRIIDLSKAAAQELGVVAKGTAKVKVELLPEETLAMINSLTGQRLTWNDLKNQEGKTNTARRFVSVDRQAPSPALASLTSGYYVQSGSFSNIQNAQSHLIDLSQKTKAEIVPATVLNRNFYRVQIGPFASREEAQNHALDLSRSGFPARLIESE